MKRNLHILAAAMTVAFLALANAFAENGDEQPGGSPSEARERDRPESGRAPGRGRFGSFRPPQFPLMTALDTNQDGEISAEEMEQAATSLKSLDKNDDGKLTRQEMRPQFDARSRGEHPDGPPGHRHTQRRGPRSSDPGERDGHPPHAHGTRPEGPDRFGFQRPGPDRLIDHVMKLDADDDGQLSREETAKLFTTADRNEDGFVSRDELQDALIDYLEEHRPLRHRPPHGHSPHGGHHPRGDRGPQQERGDRPARPE